MPLVTDGRRERQIDRTAADLLLGHGIVHVTNPFDQGTLGLCPEHTWAEVEAVTGSEATSSSKPT